MTPADTARGHGLQELLRPFLTGLMFLTRVPCPQWVGNDPAHLARSTTYFPVIGALVGAAGALVFALASLGLSTMVAATLSTVATVWLTGAFHEDALADACDGFGGGWKKEQVLAIMKDSRVGSYGVVGLALVLMAKVAALASIGAAGGTMDVVRALVAAHVLCRWSSLPLIRWCDYVREAGSKSRPFAASVTDMRLAMGSVLAAGFVAMAVPHRAAAATLAGVAITTIAGRYFRRRIGGITGDCLGAANQVVELGVYVVLAWHWSGQPSWLRW